MVWGYTLTFIKKSCKKDCVAGWVGSFLFRTDYENNDLVDLEKFSVCNICHFKLVNL